MEIWWLLSVNDWTLVSLWGKERAQINEILDGNFSSNNLRCDIWNIDLSKVNTDCIGFAIFYCTWQHPENEQEVCRLMALIVESKTLNPEEWDLVVYYRDDKMKHIWILQADGRVLSKWGRNRILAHPIEFVPQQYWNKVIFYKRKKL